MENNYEKLRKLVYQKIYPDGIPLEFGCEVKDFLKGTLVILKEYKFYENEPPVYDFVFLGETRISCMRTPRGNWDVLGKPLDLQNILRALKIAIQKEQNKERIMDVDIGKAYSEQLIYEGELLNISRKLDLTKPISEQEEEVLQKVYNFIK